MAENNSSASLLPCRAAIGDLPEAVIDAVSAALGDAYDCHRVWSAWSYGTMGPDDFGLVAEDGERVAEIARAAIEAYVAAQAVAAQAAPTEGIPCRVCGAEEAFTGSCGVGRSNPRAHCFEHAALAATPALPATEDSSAGDLAEVHPDDAAVDAMAAKMKDKLAKQRAKGYGGWDTPECSQQRLSAMLREHVAKGDPVDVANFCAFLAARGEGIEAEVQAEPVMIYHGRCTIDCGEHGHHDVEMLKMIPAGAALFTAPQAQPADALEPIRQAVRDYHYALDARQHGGVAAHKALYAIEEALGTHWQQGQETGRRAAMAAAQEGGNAAKEA